MVAYSISNIASYDWPNDWQELFDIIVKCLSGNENSVHGAMKVLVEFTLDLDKQIVEVGPMILSEVYRIFEAQNVYSVSTRSYAVEILTSLLRSINTHIESKQEQSTILNPTLPTFMQKMIEGLTVPNGPHSSFQLKTAIIKGRYIELMQFHSFQWPSRRFCSSLMCSLPPQSDFHNTEI